MNHNILILLWVNTHIPQSDNILSKDLVWLFLSLRCIITITREVGMRLIEAEMDGVAIAVVVLMCLHQMVQPTRVTRVEHPAAVIEKGLRGPLRELVDMSMMEQRARRESRSRRKKKKKRLHWMKRVCC